MFPVANLYFADTQVEISRVSPREILDAIAERERPKEDGEIHMSGLQDMLAKAALSASERRMNREPEHHELTVDEQIDKTIRDSDIVMWRTVWKGGSAARG